MSFDLDYATSTIFGVTISALLFLPLVHAVRLPAWASAIAALVVVGGLYMFNPYTVFEYGLEPYSRIDAPYFLLAAAIAALVCIVVSKVAFRYAIAWQTALIAFVMLFWTTPVATNFGLMALLTGAAIGLFRVHTLRASIVLSSMLAMWLMFLVAALHPAMWGQTELGALVRHNPWLAFAPILAGFGLQLGAALNRRMVEAHLDRVRKRAELELSVFVERLWPSAGALA